MIQIIDENWRTKQTKISHDTIKRIILMNPNKNFIRKLKKNKKLLRDLWNPSAWKN